MFDLFLGASIFDFGVAHWGFDARYQMSDLCIGYSFFGFLSLMFDVRFAPWGFDLRFSLIFDLRRFFNFGCLNCFIAVGCDEPDFGIGGWGAVDDFGIAVPKPCPKSCPKWLRESLPDFLPEI